MIAGNLPYLPDYVAQGSIKVHAPTYVVFLCGGKVKPKSPHPTSLRDALVRVSHRSALAKYDVRLAEEMEWALPLGEYTQLLIFESDIAQISNLIVLFSESAGSIAELGSFARDDEIASRMVVFVDNKNYADESFIKLGPIDYLEKTYGEVFVSVLRISDFKVPSIQEVTGIDLDKFLEAVNGTLTYHLKRRLEPRTFDPARHGHVTKLITGVVQHYAALTLAEIELLLENLGVKLSEQERTIRATVHHAITGKLSDDELQVLAGMLAFAKSVEPEFLAQLGEKYGSDHLKTIMAIRRKPRLSPHTPPLADT